jgi:ABC-type multidrug transport system fused ATPase/permease subunit
LEKSKDRFKSVGEAIGGIKFTKVLGKENYFLESYRSGAKEFFDAQSWYQVVGKVPKYIMEIIAFGGVLALVLYFIYSDQMTNEVIPLIGLFAFAGYRLMPALQIVYASFTTFRFNQPVLNKIHYDMKEGGLADVEVDFKEGIPEQIEFKKDIKLDNISFSYDGNRKKVLEDINMKIGKDMSIGIVGTTGSGKTTLVDIVLGLLTPTEGNIYIDGTKITEDNVKNWQANLGYVPQEIFLCDDTIKKNIAFGYDDEEIDMERVKRVSRMANINELIEKELPDGYDTVIGERGVRLSGGQRQRIGIARALYHDPSVLIFDEATSSLDNVTERGVLKAIESVSKLKTMIVIAHRLTTVKNCDRIYLIDRGRVIDKGKYSELERRNEKFKEMVGRRV